MIPGQRVRLKVPIDTSVVEVPCGATGTVVSSQDGLMRVRMDEEYDDLAEWDNCLQVCEGPYHVGDLPTPECFENERANHA